MYYIDKLLSIGCDYSTKGTYYLSAMFNLVNKEEHYTLDDMYKIIAETYGVKPNEVRGAVNYLIKDKLKSNKTVKQFLYDYIKEWEGDIQK